MLASVDTFLIGWFITGNVIFAGSIESLEVLTKMALYYLHERAWARSLGREARHLSAQLRAIAPANGARRLN